MLCLPCLALVAACPAAAVPTVGALVGALGVGSLARGAVEPGRVQAIVMSVARARVRAYDEGPLDTMPVMFAGLIGYASFGTLGAFGASLGAGIARAAFLDAVDAPVATKKREEIARRGLVGSLLHVAGFGKKSEARS